MNLLRQELAGTSIYLDILQKTTSESSVDDTNIDNEEEKLIDIAEERLVTFCEQVLNDASDLQSNMGETTNMDIHRVLELRSPVIVKVSAALLILFYKTEKFNVDIGSLQFYVVLFFL